MSRLVVRAVLEAARKRAVDNAANLDEAWIAQERGA